MVKCALHHQAWVRESQRGRGSFPVLKMIPSKRSPLHGRPGDYNEFSHGTSVIFKLAIRQIRRICSIRNMLRKGYTQKTTQHLQVNGSSPESQRLSPKLRSLVPCQGGSVYAILTSIDAIQDV